MTPGSLVASGIQANGFSYDGYQQIAMVTGTEPSIPAAMVVTPPDTINEDRVTSHLLQHTYQPTTLHGCNIPISQPHCMVPHDCGDDGAASEHPYAETLHHHDFLQ